MRNIGKIYGAINVPIHNYECLPKLEAPTGYVYVIQDMDVSKCYKIGRTNHPATRLIHQFGDLPFEIRVVAIFKTNDALALEKKLHQCYAAQKTRGEEWFKLDDQQVAEIKSMGKDTSIDTKAQAQRRAKTETQLHTFNVPIHNYERLPPLKAPAGYVYVIQDVDISKCYKIGYTNHPATRMMNFGVQLPLKIKVIAMLITSNASALEQELHRRYADQRTRGEWFELTDRQIQEIRRI